MNAFIEDVPHVFVILTLKSQIPLLTVMFCPYAVNKLFRILLLSY